MGISTNSHDKKSDKGTQSPLLKIFKEIIMRENNDSEKRNLLPSHQELNEDKKRKQYNTSRIKIDRRSNGSISSEHRKRSPHKTVEQRSGHIQANTCTPFPTDNKDSWLNWTSRSRKRDADEETCSCASCALRRIISSEYAYIACLLLIFLISIVAACLLVFKGVPIVATESTDKPDIFKNLHGRQTVDSERLKRKIDAMNDNGEKNELSDGVFGKQQFDDILRQDAMSLPASSDIDFGPSFRELSGFDDGDVKSEDDMELANFLEPEKLDVQGNEKLREFYKKLVQTDAKIKSLKKGNTQESYLNNNNYENKTPDRFRRSLKLYNYPKKYHIRRRRGLYNKKTDSGDQRKSLKRSKRFGNATGEPTGFVLEKKKLVIQYQPEGKRKVAKCSHTPKESNQHHHEHELKHPFYQNSERLDELLDKFFNKNLPELMTDPFDLDILFEQRKNKCKHPNVNDNMSINIDQKHSNEKDKLKENDVKINEMPDDKTVVKDKDYKIINSNDNQMPKPFVNLIERMDQKAISIYNTPTDVLNLATTEPTSNYEQKFYNDEANMIANEKNNVVTASTNAFQVMLSVSTLMNRKFGRSDNLVTAVPLIDRVPQIRRLMQAEEEEEILGYEDFKEVLTDDMENQDDVDRRADRKKRDEEEAKKIPFETSQFQDEGLQGVPGDTVPKVVKFNPPGVHNPNWKGPMPLYPDELSSMIQHAAMGANKLAKLPPTNTIDTEVKTEVRKKKATADLDYIEDYLDNGYGKLVEMAQAYSDYGVLEGKKDISRNEKNQPTENISPGPRVKLSASGNFFTGSFLERLKKGGSTLIPTSTKGNFISPSNEQNAAISRTPYNMDQSSEGIRIEIRPTDETRDDDLQVTKVLQSHFKINPEIEALNMKSPHTELIFSPKVNYTALLQPNHKTIRPSDNNDYASNSLIFAIHKGRSLLSTQNKKSIDFDDEFDYTIRDEDEITTELNMDKQNDEMIIYEILNHLKAKPITTVFQKNEDKDKQMSPDLTDFVLEQYSKTQNCSHLSQNANNPLSFLNTPKFYKAMAVKTVTPLITDKIDNSGTILFKSTNSDEARKPTTNKTLILNSYESPVTLVAGKHKLNVFDKQNSEGDFDFSLQKPDLDILNIDYSIDYSQLNDYNQELYNTYVGHNDDSSRISPNVFKEKITNANTLKDKEFIKNSLKTNSADAELYMTTNDFEQSMNSSTEFAETVALNKTTNISKSNLTSKTSAKNNMKVNDFFSKISNWFQSLEKFKADRNKTQPSTGPDFVNLLFQYGHNCNKNKILSTTTDIVNPELDPNVKEIIGHKSRLLMSIKDDNATHSEGKGEKDHIEMAEVKSMNVSGNESNKIIANTTANMVNINNSTTPLKTVHTTSSALKKHRKLSRKVKRNADNSNLILWNDIYDDEYGIQTDNFDNVNIGDKYSRRQNDFIKRSGRWVQEKFKKFADNLKGRDQDLVTRKRIPRDTIRKIGLGQYSKYILNKILKRESALENKYESDQKAMFNALGANLVLVCRKAANAVKQVKNIEVKEDTKQGTIASSLMQQLVGLLAEIVDYQVQQKTCTKLTPDLQSYLEWLTQQENDSKNVKVPESESASLKVTQTYSKIGGNVAEEKKSPDRSQILETPPSYEKDDQQKTSYLDTLRSIEDLMEEYQMMNDEDKSKMTGVKYYLENQLNYLKNEIGSSLYDFYGNSNLYYRYKRNRPPKEQKRRKRKLHKFIKNFGKKHTRTTAGYYDGVAITEMKKLKDERIETVEANRRQKKLQEAVPKGVKRNLKDVYYHAVAEAKKYTKDGHKKENTADFSTTQNIKLHNYDYVSRVLDEKANSKRSQ